MTGNLAQIVLDTASKYRFWVQRVKGQLGLHVERVGADLHLRRVHIPAC